MGKVSAVVLFGLFVASLGACHKRDTCRMLAARNRRCASAFEQVLVPSTPTGNATALRKAAQRTARDVQRVFTGPAYLQACHRAWLATNPEDRKLQQAARSCLREDSCEAYVRCVLQIRPHRGTGQP